MLVETNHYVDWFAGLRSAKVKAIINARLRRIELGNFEDCEPVGEGVSELRIHYGPGYRVYFAQRGLEIIILLASGDKSSRPRDEKLALELARQL